MKVCVIGTGYVGLTTGLCLAYIGHDVCCLDVDANKVDSLRQGIPTIYEPGIRELLAAVSDRIRFTDDASEALHQAQVVFIAVGTPPLPDGNPDLRYLRQAGEEIGRRLNGNSPVVVNKSTVPVGSGNWIESIVRDSYQAHHGRSPQGNFNVASNPEFLREGSAIHDSLYPDRIVIGGDDGCALHVLEDLYRPITEQSFPSPAFAPRPEGFGAVATSAAVSLPKHDPPHPSPACRKRGPIRASRPMPSMTCLILAPTRSARWPISFAKLIFIERKELAAYLMSSAEARSVATKATAPKPSGRGANAGEGKLCSVIGRYRSSRTCSAQPSSPPITIRSGYSES